MKRVLSFALLTVLLLSLFGCGQQTDPETVPSPVPESSQAVQEGPAVQQETETETTALPAPAETVSLTLAMTSGNYVGSYYHDLIAEFNDEDNGCAIEMLDYGDDAQRLMLEFAAGTGPDLLMSFGNDGVLTTQGCLLDLYPLMDNDPDVSREDFVHLDMLAYGETLTRVSPGFHLTCPFGSAEVYEEIGRENWTLDQYLSLLREADTPQDMTGNVTCSYFVLSLLPDYIRRHVDYVEGTCDFETEQFYSILNTAKAISLSDTDPDVVQSSGRTYAELFREYPRLVYGGDISGVAGYTTLMQALADCPVTFLGRPTEEGGRAQAGFVDTLSGTASTEYPDQVWSFLRYALTADSVQEDTSLFPVYAPALERQLAEAVENAPKTPSQTPLTQQEALAQAAMGNVEPSFTAEQAEELRQLLYTDCIYSGYDGVIAPIVQEEMPACFDGSKSPEEVAALIQNRVSIYLSEQKPLG